MRDTAENRNAVQAVVRQIAGRFGGGFPIDPDYATETGNVLLAECPTVAVLSSVASELCQFDRLPFAREIEALARKNTPERTGKFFDNCPLCSDPSNNRHNEGWYHFDREKNGVPYSFAGRCSCRDGGGR